MLARSLLRSYLGIAVVLLSIRSLAQEGDTARWYRFSMDDGSTIIGTIAGGSENVFRVRTRTLGTVDVELAHVVRMVRITPEGDPPSEQERPREEKPPMTAGDTLSRAEGQRIAERAHATTDSLRWFIDRHASHYFLAPSALPMRAGRAYYRNVYLVVQSFAVALTDHLAVGAGLETFSMFSFSRSAPSFQVNVRGGWGIGQHLHLGIEGIYVNSATELYEGDLFDIRRDGSLREGTGVLHAMATVSDPRVNLTVGGGVRYSEWSSDDLGMQVNVSFAARVLPKLWLLTEEWYHTIEGKEGRAWWSLGIRFSTPRTALDVGLVNNSDLRKDLYYGFPFIAFSANIGGK
ncbi:MAG: hypothetical protein H6595_13615 [Flavobacteriales bacterium]|nr:hypothetical protein [Flavobacteriales bacterium]MCB9168504.1 hypothetical protein [Flavobacteriales bacterium]